MGIYTKVLLALLGLCILLAMLNKSMFAFIEENIPFIEELETMEKGEKEENEENEEKEENEENDNSYAASFCRATSDNIEEMEEKCGKLTNDNCKNMDCCVLLNGAKCVSGTSHGPSYPPPPLPPPADPAMIGKDYYYYKNKCHGGTGACPPTTKQLS